MTKRCSICKRKYFGMGHNAIPINRGRCCDLCHFQVLSARAEAMQKELDRGKEEATTKDD